MSFWRPKPALIARGESGRAKLSIRDLWECFGNRALFQAYKRLFDTKTSVIRGPIWQEQRGTIFRDRFGTSLIHVIRENFCSNSPRTATGGSSGFIKQRDVFFHSMLLCFFL